MLTGYIFSYLYLILVCCDLKKNQRTVTEVLHFIPATQMKFSFGPIWTGTRSGTHLMADYAWQSYTSHLMDVFFFKSCFHAPF